MKTKHLPQILALVAALTLTACGGGGGGGGGGAAPPPPPPPVGTVTTDLQAKTLAARSIDAMFAYDNMNSEVIVSSLAPLPVVATVMQAGAATTRRQVLITGDDGGAGSPPLGSGTYAVPCASGSGTTTYLDADGDNHVSVGDFATLAGTACQPEAGVAWAFGGSVKVEIVGGSNVERHLYFVDVGSAQLRVTHAGTPIGGQRTANGIYSITMSNTVSGTPPDQTISMADMTIAHPDVNLRMTALSFQVMASSSIATAAGTFETTIDGIGSVQLALAVKSPLTVDSSTPRFRPSAGTVTLTASDFSFDVQYGAGGAVTIRVDNGKDGSIDRTVTTTETELDSLLTVK